MQAKAIVGGRLVSFRLSPELARAHRANAGKTMTDAEAVACVEKKRRSLVLVSPQAISARSLKMLDKSAASLKKGMASPPVNLSRFRED